MKAGKFFRSLPRGSSCFCCWLSEVGLLQRFLHLRKLPLVARKALAGPMLCRPAIHYLRQWWTEIFVMYN